MRLGGLLKFSLIDYPGRTAAVIFTQGCNFRCPFCHNPELVIPGRFHDPLDVEGVFAFLEKRRGQLQGVVVTGGEPTVHEDLVPFLSRIKAMGYLVKLDTNGSNPEMVRAVARARLVDFWSMDIKTSPEKYASAAGREVDIGKLRESIECIKAAGVAYEFRTTAFPAIVSESDMDGIAALIGKGQPYHIRKGNVVTKMIDPRLVSQPGYVHEEWERILKYYRN